MKEENIVRRLERLERENRRLKHAGLAALVTVLSIALLAAMRPQDQSNVIEAQRIIVRDPVSGSRAVLGGEGLFLYDAAGNVRVELREDRKSVV